MKIMDYQEKKKKNNIIYYSIGVLIGIIIFLIIIYGSKLILYLVEFIFKNWIWFILIILVVFLLKKIFIKNKRKPIPVIIQNENYTY